MAPTSGGSQLVGPELTAGQGAQTFFQPSSGAPDVAPLPSQYSGGYNIKSSDFGDYSKIVRPANFSGIATGGGAGSIRQGAVFPERIGFDLTPLWDAVNGTAGGLQTLFGNLKAIPGVTDITRSIGASPIGGALNLLGSAITSPFKAAGYLLSTPLQGQNITDAIAQGKDPWETLKQNFELNRGIIGAGLEVASTVATVGAGSLVKSGIKTAAGDFLWGATHPFVNTEAANAFAWLVAPVARDVFREVGQASLAKSYGLVTGRLALAGTVLGEAENLAIKAVAPDSWAAKEIADNRFVAPGSDWEVPLQLVSTLPLDIFGLAGRFKNILGASRLSTVLGEHNAMDIVFEGWHDAVKNGTLPRAAVEWANNKGFRDAAMWRALDEQNAFIQILNRTKVEADQLPLIAHPNLLNIADQQAFNDAVLKHQGEIMKLPSGQRAQEIADAIVGRGVPDSIGYRPGWQLGDLDPATRLSNLGDFHPLAKYADQHFGGEMLVIDRNMGRQLENAVATLRADTFTGTKEAFNAWMDKYPAFADFYKAGMKPDYLADFITNITTTWKSAPEPVKVGMLQAKKFDLDQQIFRAGAKASQELLDSRAAVAAELEAVAKRAAKPMWDEAALHEAAIHQIDIQIQNFEGPEAVFNQATHHLEEEKRVLQELVSVNRRAAFNVESLSNSRYQLGKPPVGIIQPVFAKTGIAMPGGRTDWGRAFDRLFGALPNSVLGREAFGNIKDSLMERGLTYGEVRSVIKNLENKIADDLHTTKTGFRHSKYQSVYQMLAHDQQKALVDVVGRDRAAGINIHEMFYRAYPSPLKISQRMIFGKEVAQMPYNRYLVNLTRTLYPMFRFYYSPRFIAMNMLEPQFFQGFFGGPKAASLRKLSGGDVEIIRSMVEQHLRSSGTRNLGFIEQFQTHFDNIVKLAATQAHDNTMAMVLDTLYKSPEMKDLMQTLGVKSQPEFYKVVAGAVREKEELMRGLAPLQGEEVRLSRYIDDLKTKMARGLPEADRISHSAAIEEAQTALRDLQVDRTARFNEAWGKITPELQPFVDAYTAGLKQSVTWATQVLYGNPSRTAIERTLNSFLLYWPISYQIKATKAMAQVLLDRSFGFKSNATGAALISDLYRQHKERLKTNAKYAQFFKDNYTALFLFNQLLPAVPDETGVSLGPVLRLPLQVARGYRTPQEALDKLTDVGIIYDKNLVMQLLDEQSKRPGSIWHMMFPPTGSK